ncbi:MAG TPA: PEP/pyruvate-binding domain-containing protein [Phycisphaerae bacterium]|nr:PEP/pyruvate-binding domain-containing protein [Phycisphaerae bacterium]
MNEVTNDLPFEEFATGLLAFHRLFASRVQDVLLVCSLYESFILEEDGLVADLILSKYQELNLSHAPQVSHVSTGEQALRLIKDRHFDLVITMTRLGDMEVPVFAAAVKCIKPELTVIVLTDDPREVAPYSSIEKRGAIDRFFMWYGDAKILLAIIKHVEDRLNVEHDTRVGDVRVIILIENSMRFYSSYLPLIYTELMKQTQALMAEGINPVHKLLRMRARPKILLAETFEQAWGFYTKFRSNLLGVISDVRFSRDGVLDSEAGLEFVRRVKKESPQMPVLLQSSDASHERAAAELGACFLHKKSMRLLQELRGFILNNFGFGDFVFRMPDGREVARATDLRDMVEKLRQVPDESLLYHGGSDHFSNWLMARTEFELAARIRPRKVSEFADAAGLRKYLIDTLSEFYERSQAGVIADFSRRQFSRAVPFARIGGGSIGGKARGLAFINALLKRYDVRHRWPGVRVAVPNSAALGTEIFDSFLEENRLGEVLVQDRDDEELARVFLACELPQAVRNDLAAFVQSVHCPLAVRSSSLLEDSHGQPFAGIYRTYMIPNNHPDEVVRLEQLCNAVKLVYASTFFRAARHYQEATGHHGEEEKMGVILQELVGAQYEDRYYPTFSGVARSYNFYPLGRLKPEDGIACVALGLGKMVVEGGEMLMFSPKYPQVLPQFSTAEDMLANAQRTFFALDMRHPGPYRSADADQNLIRSDLDVAERDGTLAAIGSVYCPEDDAVYDGIVRAGSRLVTFAHVLKAGVFPLAEILTFLVEIGQQAMACPIEIEFAVNMKAEPMQFSLLQMRPTVSDEAFEQVSLENVDQDKLVCYSPQTMGNGYIRNVRDIVFVKPEAFDSAHTRSIVGELSQVNENLRKAGRPCLLIGPGRWGSADPWLGIPVMWEHISAAQVVVESSLENFVVAPSQGSHFFQNLTCLRVGYLTVNPTAGGGFVDWDWLERQPAVTETKFLRHVRFDEPLEVRLDGRTRRGMIFKPRPA